MMYKATLWKQRRRKELREKRDRILITAVCIIMLAIGIYGFVHGTATALQAAEPGPEQMIDTGELYRVECTAYDNTEGNLTASGRPTVEGLTVAGAREWLGCTCILYDENMNFIGFYEFADTGYGRDGDILRGETIDLYFDRREDAVAWGRQTVYIQIVSSEG